MTGDAETQTRIGYFMNISTNIYLSGFKLEQ